ncbi:hypothetical protein D9611_004121 [Ephemerocybe angulata]|uniref:DUF6533 domain-containing protein n=1 Tax=Ephemerocybe angulata TaxID=980116 RepID=A0A8H5BKV2_9AGAR|nr:hypothetical protein D9611_004121 [Tulosesus angulatus]
MNTNSFPVEFIEDAKIDLNTRYLFIAITVFAFAEALHCLPLEISLIWARKWNLGKVLYLLARYLVFVELIGPAPFISLSPNLSVNQCQWVFVFGALLTVVEVTVAEAILFLRVYAIGGTDRRLGAFLLTIFVGIHSAAYALLFKFITSIVCTCHVVYAILASVAHTKAIIDIADFGFSVDAPSPYPELIPCYTFKAEAHLLSVAFILLLVSELAILVITIWLCFSKHKSTKSPLIATFSRDGLIYFLLLSAVSAGNIICNLVAPLGYIYMLTVPQMVLHSTLSTRMVLHVRKLGPGIHGSKGDVALGTSERNGTTRSFQSMRFAAAPPTQVRSKNTSHSGTTVPDTLSDVTV